MNLIGDFGIIITFIIYMLANNFYIVVIGEILCGIFTAMTNGVDNSFLKFYSEKLDNTGELFKKNNAKLSIYQSIGFAIAIFIGMIISKYSIRIAIGAVSIPFIIGTIISLFIDDIGEKIKCKEKEKSHLFISSIKYILKENEMKWLVFAWAISDNASHAIIWVLSPLLILVGVPIHIVGIGWIINYFVPILGSIVAKKVQNIALPQKFIFPFLLVIVGTLPIIINVNIWNVWLFGLTGFASGFHKVYLLPVIQERNKDRYQTTTISIITTASRLLYLPIVYIVNKFGDEKPQNALIANLILIIPLALLINIKLKKFKDIVKR